MTNRDQWIQDRCGKLTASEIYKIMGKGKTKDQYFGQVAESYMLQKVGEILTLEPNNGGRVNISSLEWGNHYESEAATKFQERYDLLSLQYFGVSNPKFYSYNEYCGGSPDGVFESVTGEQGIIEIKCPYNSAEQIRHFGITDSHSLQSVAPEYYWQMVANMLFTETRIGYFISYDPRMVFDKHKLHVVPIEPIVGDMDILKERISEASKWILYLVNKLNTNE
jgi:hypothetical protein